MKHLIRIATLMTVLASPLAAQTMDHSGHGAAGMGHDAAAMAFAEANARMHEGMAIAPSGNVDVDFVRGMIPHHQGAVDMARIVLEHGTDPEVRKFAEAVIAAQEAEIAWMTAWLAKNGG